MSTFSLNITTFANPGCTYQGFQPGKDGFSGGTNGNFNFDEGLYNLRPDPGEYDPGEQYDVKAYYHEVVVELKKIADKPCEDLADDLTVNPGKNCRKPGRIKN